MSLKDKIQICFPESDSEIDLLSLPFKSSYRVLSWRGRCDNNLMTPDFNLLDIVGKILVIKSFKIICYYNSSAVDLYVTDGATINEETIPENARIERLFDDYTVPTKINLKINGGPVNLFNANFPFDLDLQNIYFKYPEKIQDLTLQINTVIFSNIRTNFQQQPYAMVNMEVYLI